MPNEIKVEINSTLRLENAQGQTLDTKAQGQMGNVLGALSAQFLVQGGVKLANSLGNAQLSRALGQGTKFAFLGVQMLSGNPLAVATLGLNLASEAIKVAMQNKRDMAKMMNEIDNARIKAGLLDIGMSGVTTNFYGRYKYGRG